MTEENKKVLTSGPGWLQNSSSTWPQTIYNMYMSLSNNLAGEQANSAAFEMQAQAIIYACLGDLAFDFVDKKWDQYYDKVAGAKNAKTLNTAAIRNNLWLRLAGEAVEVYNKKYAGDGYVCKSAVTWIPEGVKFECLQPGTAAPEEKGSV